MNLLNLSDDKPEDDAPIIESPPVEPVVDDPKQRTLALIGAILMTVGVFMPIVRFPVYGSLNYFNNGSGDGVIILILSCLAFFLLAKRKSSGFLILGGLALAVLIFTLISLIMRISAIKANLSKGLEGNPFREIGDAMISAVQVEWGWLPLFGGAVLLVIAGLRSEKPWKLPQFRQRSQ